MRATPALERFLAKVSFRESGCWIWTGFCNPKGYGAFWFEERVTGAHRASYAMFVGPIPAGLTIDHLCRVPSCVNPDHMEVVTSGVNTLRGFSVSAQAARRFTCPAGHPYDSTTPRNSGSGVARRCRHCRTARSRERRRIAAIAAGGRGAPGERTHCPRGHAYDETNTYYRGGERRKRTCRACLRARYAEKMAQARTVVACG